MGVYINTDDLSGNVNLNLQKTIIRLEKSIDNIQKANRIQLIVKGIEDEAIKAQITTDLENIDDNLTNLKKNMVTYENQIDEIISWINKKVDKWEDAEKTSTQISSSILYSGVSSINSNSKSKINTSTKVSKAGSTIKGNGKKISSKVNKLEDSLGKNLENPEEMQKIVPDEPITSADIIGDNINIKNEVENVNSVTQTVIEMIYGKNAELTDEEKQTVVNAVENIDKTGMLNELDEETANQMKAQIIKDGMENKYDLNNITNETLQEYIVNQPDLNIQFELKKAKDNFDTLISNEILTQEQVNSVTGKVQIYDTDEEFMQAYQNAGGTETDLSKIQVFYDSETQRIHIHNTADSKAITQTMIEAIGEKNLFYDEITNQVASLKLKSVF